jgi:hypothetical protein
MRTNDREYGLHLQSMLSSAQVLALLKIAENWNGWSNRSVIKVGSSRLGMAGSFFLPTPLHCSACLPSLPLCVY